MQLWQHMSVVPALFVVCGALPQISSIVKIPEFPLELKNFNFSSLLYGGSISASLAAAGLGIFEAGVLTGFITNYSNLQREAYEKDKEEREELLEELREDEEIRIQEEEEGQEGEHNKKSAFVYNGDYIDDNTGYHVAPAPSHRLSQSSTQGHYHMLSYSAYDPHTQTRHKRSTRKGLQEVEAAQKMLVSAVIHLDTDGCLLKLLCHLHNKRPGDRTLQENIILQFLSNSPEMLSSYKAALINATKVGGQSTCIEVFPKCVLRDQELGSLLQRSC
ncbi:uncharacterized protein [Cherax quadricarinatus]|uniref:uncharacterized protein n=1 Tax=Cherax quadricarinatus TaxID=27406 RepID=UPI00387EABE0